MGGEKGNDDNNKEKMSIRSVEVESESVSVIQRQPAPTTAPATKVRKVSTVSILQLAELLFRLNVVFCCFLFCFFFVICVPVLCFFSVYGSRFWLPLMQCSSFGIEYSLQDQPLTVFSSLFLFKYPK